MKLCKDCKYFKPCVDVMAKHLYTPKELKELEDTLTDWTLSLCTHEKCKAKDINFLVNGKYIAHTAIESRKYETLCGQDAKYFESKQ